jgi:hypothetical protein
MPPEPVPRGALNVTRPVRQNSYIPPNGITRAAKRRRWRCMPSSLSKHEFRLYRRRFGRNPVGHRVDKFRKSATRYRLVGHCWLAFVGTNPTGELITSGLSVIHAESARRDFGTSQILTSESKILESKSPPFDNRLIRTISQFPTGARPDRPTIWVPTGALG